MEDQESQDYNCDRDHLSKAVAAVSSKLEKMKSVYAEAFQQKLRQLKKQKRWSDQEFIKNAATFVKNEKIEAYDAQNKELMASIAALGGNDTQTKKQPDCVMLVQLNSRLLKNGQKYPGKMGLYVCTVEKRIKAGPINMAFPTLR